MKTSEKYHKGLWEMAQIIAEKLHKKEEVNPLWIIAIELYTSNRNI